MLTEKQQETFDLFLYIIEQSKIYFLSSEPRRIGKTYILNELGFTLQALGYEVYILTPYPHQEYFANGFISTEPRDFRGMFKDNTIIIVDEERFELIGELLDYCRSRNIPVVGYVNFDEIKPVEPIEFKTEYKYEWIK